MADDDPDAASNVVGDFVIEELVGATGDLEVSRARDRHVDRAVLVRTARGATATCLLEDARQIAAVSDPALVVVLGAGRSETGSFAAVGELDAQPLSHSGALSSHEAARVAIDIAGAIAALSDAGLRTPINDDTVLVSRTAGGVRGLLDPLRAIAPGVSCLAGSAPHESTTELVDLLERAVPEPSDELRQAITGVRSGTLPGPSELASALDGLARPPRPHERRARRLVLPGFLAIAAIAVVALVYDRSRDSSSPHPIAAAPAARIVATIPLGLPPKDDPAAAAILRKSLWIVTFGGRLLRVDARTNRTIGSPIVFGAKHSFWSIVASAGSLYTADYQGWLLRVDPATGKVTGRRHLAPHLTAIRVSGEVLWIAAMSSDGVKGSLLRVSPTTLQPIAAPLAAIGQPYHLQVRGKRAWILGGTQTGEVARLDAPAGARRIVYVGPQADGIGLAGSTVWVTDNFNGTLSALDADRLRFTRESVSTPRSSVDLAVSGSDIWVTTAVALEESAPLRLERFDARSGRRAGRAVALGGGGRGTIISGLGSLWVLTAKGLARLDPTLPRPALAPIATPARGPRSFLAGPLSQGTWRASAFVTPFTFSTAAFRWLGVHPLRDGVSLLGTGDRYVELDVDAPSQMFATDTTNRPVSSPEAILSTMRRNPRLLVGAVHHIVVGGRPALQFELRARNAVPHPEVCGPQRCVLLFPTQFSTNTIASGQVERVSLLRSGGHTIFISEGGVGDDRVALRQTASLLRTFHFKA